MKHTSDTVLIYKITEIMFVCLSVCLLLSACGGMEEGRGDDMGAVSSTPLPYILRQGPSLEPELPIQLL